MGTTQQSILCCTTDAPQTHHRRTTDTLQTHYRHTTDTPQTHYRHTTDTSQTDHYFFFSLHVFYEGVFQNLAFCARVAQTYSQMAPKWLPRSSQNGSPGSQMAPRIHSKWVPGCPPATSKTRFRKKVANFPEKYLPRLQKDTKNGSPNHKSRSRIRFVHDLKKK